MYQPGDVIDRTYRVSRRLALGGAGVTYLVRALGEKDEETGPWIALKLLFANRDHGAYLRRLSTEAAILQELHHPNIVGYLGFVHRTGQSPYLLTQFEEGGSLLDHMKRVGTMSVRCAAAVGRQVCLALEKGHAQGITHRDLKPENLLLRAVTPE
jgi:serine/threonine protein kinase